MSVVSSSFESLQDHLRALDLAKLSDNLPVLFKRHLKLASFTTLAVILTPWLYKNYLEFMALGPGGAPYNAGGWLFALSLKIFSVQTLNVRVYDQDKNKQSWLDKDGLPRREGPRPDSGFHVFPVRQFDQLPPKDISERLDEFVKRIVTLNPTLVTFERSPHESVHEGVLIHPSLPSPHEVADAAIREIAHVHKSDHSMHVLLAPQDCKTAIEKGWGERHKLAGSKPLNYLPLPQRGRLPKEYVWIYAPRNEKELAAVQKFLVAGVRYMTNTRDVQT